MSLLSCCPFSHLKWTLKTMEEWIWPLCLSDIIRWNYMVISLDNLKLNYSTQNIFPSQSVSHLNFSYVYFLTCISIIVLEVFGSDLQLILTNQKVMPSAGYTHSSVAWNSSLLICSVSADPTVQVTDDWARCGNLTKACPQSGCQLIHRMTSTVQSHLGSWTSRFSNNSVLN